MTLASPPQPRLPFFQRVERFFAALSVRDNFWHRAFSFVFLPAASKSGISMRWTDDGELRPRMPYRRVN
ncbi:MAG: hypothetical protein VXX15_06960, partial [Planctomycetota bacterium]|nr:hypothetical protein [Planctomycetota bacterium]